MIGKIILIAVLAGIFIFFGWFLYQNLPGEPKNFQITDLANKEIEPVIEYSSVKQFHNNMRFNHNHFPYHIDESCSEDRKQRMKEAFLILQDKVGIISFAPTTETKAEIFVGCSEDYLEQEENKFIVGEGGPTEIINTSIYNIILKGKILLYKESRCDSPIVELHELLHVLGFDHSQNPKNIMYNVSSCDQEISQDIIDSLISLYSQETLPDLSILNVDATKKGRYLDFEIQILNNGMVDVKNASLVVSSNDKKIETFYLNEIEFGAGKKLWTKNLKLPYRDTEGLEFTIDKENAVKELREDNNRVELSVK